MKNFSAPQKQVMSIYWELDQPPESVEVWIAQKEKEQQQKEDKKDGDLIE